MSLQVTRVRVKRTAAAEELEDALAEAGIETVEEMTVHGDVQDRLAYTVVHPAPEGE